MFSIPIIAAIKLNKPDLLLKVIRLMKEQHELNADLSCPTLAEDTIDGVDPNTGQTPLIAAVCTEQKELEHQKTLIDILIKEGGAKLEAQDRNGYTALAIAAERNNLAMVEKLLESKDYTALKLTTTSGETPLLIAANLKHLKLVNLFTEEQELYNVQTADKHQRTLTYWMVYHGDLKRTKTLVTEFPQVLAEKYANGDRLLHLAAREKRLEILQFLMPQMKADINVRTDCRETVASLVIEHCPEEKTIIATLVALQEAVAPSKLDLGAVPITPLMWAAIHGHFEVVNHLLQLGVDVEAPENQNDALYHAIIGGHYKIAARILSVAKDPAKLVNQPGRIALAIEKGHVEMVKLLCVFGAKVDCHTPPLLCLLTTMKWSNKTPEEIIATQMAMTKILLGHQPSKKCNLLKEVNLHENLLTPLILAAKNNQAVLGAFFLGLGAAINAQDLEGRTALLYAVKNGHLNTVKTLLTTAANGRQKACDEISDTDDYNSTYAAVKYKHYEIVSYLLQEGGGNPNRQSIERLTKLPDNSYGSKTYFFSPFDEAVKQGDGKMLRILLNPSIPIPVNPDAITNAFANEMKRETGPRREVITALLEADDGINRNLYQNETFLAYVTKKTSIKYGDPEQNTAILTAIKNHSAEWSSKQNFILQSPTLATAPADSKAQAKLPTNTTLDQSVQTAIKDKNVAKFKETLQLETKDKTKPLLATLSVSTLCESLVFAAGSWKKCQVESKDNGGKPLPGHTIRIVNDCFPLFFESLKEEQAFMGLLTTSPSKKLAFEHFVAAKFPAETPQEILTSSLESILKIAPFSQVYDLQGKRRSSPKPFIKTIDNYCNQATLLDYLWFVQQIVTSGKTTVHQRFAITIIETLRKNESEQNKENIIDLYPLLAEILFKNDLNAEPYDKIGKAILCWILQLRDYRIGDLKQTLVLARRKQVNVSLKLEYTAIKIFIAHHFSWLPPIVSLETKMEVPTHSSETQSNNNLETQTEAKENKGISPPLKDLKDFLRASNHRKDFGRDQLFAAVNAQNLEALTKALEHIEKHTLKQNDSTAVTESIVDATDNHGQTALMKASANGFLAGVQKLLAAGAWPWVKAKDGVTALRLAVEHGDPLILQALIATKNVDANRQGNEDTPYRVITSTHPTLITQRQATLTLLLKHVTVNVNWRDPLTGDTALIVAARKGSRFKYLLQQLLAVEKMDPLIPNKNGESAFSIVVNSDNPDPDVVAMLLEKFFNVANDDNKEIIQLQCKKALRTAAQKGHAAVLAKILNFKPIPIQDVVIRVRGEVMDENGISYEEESNQSALYEAVINGHLEVVRLLCMKLPDKEVLNARYGSTKETLIHAALRSHFNCRHGTPLQKERSLDILKILLAARAPSYHDDCDYAKSLISREVADLVANPGNFKTALPVEMDEKHFDTDDSNDSKFSRILVGVASDQAESIAELRKIIREEQLPNDLGLLQEAFIYILQLEKSSEEAKSETTVRLSERFIKKIEDIHSKDSFLRLLHDNYPQHYKDLALPPLIDAVHGSLTGYVPKNAQAANYLPPRAASNAHLNLVPPLVSPLRV